MNLFQEVIYEVNKLVTEIDHLLTCFCYYHYELSDQNRRTVMMLEMRYRQVIETLGSRLKKLRNSKHLRQEQVANLIGVNKSAISYYENDTRQPTYASLARLASIYNVSTDYLLGLRSEETFDTSGLTTADIILVENMIQTLSDKNKRLAEYEEKYGGFQKESKKK